jgi:hypothetical protein
MRPDRRRSRPGGRHSRRTGQSVELPPANADEITVAHPFGQPSNYSLAPHELAAHIRHLRHQGWQSWEIRTRFDTRWAA